MITALDSSRSRSRMKHDQFEPGNLISLVRGDAIRPICSNGDGQPDDCGEFSGCGLRHEQSDEKLLGEMRLAWEAKVQLKTVPIPPPPEPQSLIEAAEFGYLKGVKLFLESPVARHTVNQALLLAARSEPFVIGTEGQPNAQRDLDLEYAAIARLLLAKGANIETRDQNRCTPLMYAAGHG
jgi:hypothetical protein